MVKGVLILVIKKKNAVQARRTALTLGAVCLQQRFSGLDSFTPLGNAWQCLELVAVVTSGRSYLYLLERVGIGCLRASGIQSSPHNRGFSSLKCQPCCAKEPQFHPISWWLLVLVRSGKADIQFRADKMVQW